VNLALRVAGIGLALAMASPAVAHVGLIYPPSRYGPNVLKQGPCGVTGGTRSTNVTVLEPGASIYVQWDEYINHPGHFRISFDMDGDGDFVDPVCLSGCSSRTPTFKFYPNATVLADDIPDTIYGGVSGAQITLPDLECDRCTLQLIQVMYDKPPYTLPGDDIYYQCADLILRRSQPVPTPTDSPSPTPSVPTASPTSTPSPAPPTPTPTCGGFDGPGCAVGCVGDCDSSGKVDVDELVVMVAIALGNLDPSFCASADVDGDGLVAVNEIVAAVQRSLSGCSP